MISIDRCREVGEYANKYGSALTMEHYNLPEDTFKRYMRMYRKTTGNGDTLAQLIDKYGIDGIESMLADKGKSPIDPVVRPYLGTTFKFLAMGDTHIGSKYFHPERLITAFEEAKKQECTFAVHTGDLLEGMSGRPGQIYELSHIGYRAQRDEAIRLFNQWGRDWYVIEGNHDCVRADTECLTSSGWKTYDEILPTDKVFSFNPATQKGEWQPITNLHIKSYAGDMIEVTNGSVKFSVTPNHRVFYINSKEAHTYMSAQELYDRHTAYPTAVTKFQVSADSGNEDYPISDNMLKLVSWLISDGNIKQGESETALPTYTIYQSKDHTAIEQLLIDIGADYHKKTRERNITEVCGKTLKKAPLPETSFRLRASTAREVLPYLKEKGVPAWFHELSERQFDMVARVLYHANGSSTPSDREKEGLTFGLHGTHEFLHDIQVIFASHGYATKYRKDTRGSGCLDVNKALTKEIAVEVNKVPYSGTVWCVSTPLTNFMIRHEGRTSFTGNCWGNSKHGAGITAVEDVCDRVTGSHFIGYHEGDIIINNCKIKLWHGEDSGGSYAHSYRLQKLVEAFNGGEKPQILFTGHTHKSMYLYDRNIHCVSTGCLQNQSGFMRTKRLSAHVGFWIIEVLLADNGEVQKFAPTWYPFYK